MPTQLEDTDLPICKTRNGEDLKQWMTMTPGISWSQVFLDLLLPAFSIDYSNLGFHVLISLQPEPELQLCFRQQLMRAVLPALALGPPAWTGNLEGMNQALEESTLEYSPVAAVAVAAGGGRSAGWHCPSWVVFMVWPWLSSLVPVFLWFLPIGWVRFSRLPMSIPLTTWRLSSIFFFYLTESISWVSETKNPDWYSTCPLHKTWWDWRQHFKREKERSKETGESE